MKENDQEVMEAVSKITGLIKIKPKIGMILGTGLGGMVSEFKDKVTIKFKDIPNFPITSVDGHQGEIVAGMISGVEVMAIAGRIHYYEGYSMQNVTFAVKVMARTGINKLIVTNAGGGVNENYSPGDIVIIRDHINLMGNNPLIGKPDFVDMTNAYDLNLRKLAKRTGENLGVSLKQGVYLAVSGPSYETPAEVKMAWKLGADIVGMSTVPEVIVANKYNIKVLGLSMITNMAAGITDMPLSHAEVLETSRKAQDKFCVLVKEMIKNIAQEDKEEE